MFNIGTPEMVLIAFIALVIVGPQRLPSLFRQIGRGLAQFRKIQDDVKDMVQLDQYIDLKDPDGDFIKPEPTPHRSRVAEDTTRHDPLATLDESSMGDGEEPTDEPTDDPADLPLSAMDTPELLGFTPTPELDDDEPLSAP